MGLSGNLNTMSFGDLLQFIATNATTGTLQIRQGQILKMIFFEKGKVISSSSSDPKDYLGHFLVSVGVITEEELRMAMEIQRSSKMLLGKILVMGGKISEDDMIRLLRLKTEETIYSLFLWDEGEFTFYQDEFINRLFVRISVDPQAIIFEGTLRRDEWVRMRKVFPNGSVVLENVPGVALDLELVDDQTKVIYPVIDGIRTIDEIALATHCVDYQACRVLFALFEAGYIQIRNIQPSQTRSNLLGGDHTANQLVDLVKEKISKGRYEEALSILRDIRSSADQYQTEIVPLLEMAETKLIEELYSKWVPANRVPKLLIPLNELAQIQLTPQEGFILSRLDGMCDVRSILSIIPMKEVDALRLLKGMLERGIIGFPGMTGASHARE